MKKDLMLDYTFTVLIKWNDNQKQENGYLVLHQLVLGYYSPSTQTTGKLAKENPY